MALTNFTVKTQTCIKRCFALWNVVIGYHKTSQFIKPTAKCHSCRFKELAFVRDFTKV